MSSSLKLDCRKHPVDFTGRERHEIQYRRQRLTTLISQYMSEFNGVCVWVNSNLIAEDEIKSYRCKPGDSIVIAPKVAVPIPAIAANFWAWATAVTVNAAIATAIGYGMNALLAKKPNERPTPPGVKPLYSWSQGTTATDGIPMLLCFGRVTLSGNIISSFTDYDGDENSIRNVLLSHGFGNYEGPVADTLTINGQPAASFASSITTETKYGLADQTVCTSFAAQKNEYWLDRPLTNDGGAVTFTTRGSNFDSLEFLFEYQSRYVNHSGGYATTSGTYQGIGGNQAYNGVGIKIEISVKDAATWSTLVDTNLTGGTDEIRRVKYVNTGTYTGGAAVAVSNGTDYDVKITKTNYDIDPAWQYASRYLDALKFKYMHEVIATGFTYPGQPLTAISAIGTDEVSGTLDVRETWDTQIVNKVDTTIAYSNNPADIIHFLITLPLITGSGTGPDPYVIDSYRGQDPATISNYATLLADLVLLATRCDELVATAEGGTVKRYQFNGVFADSTDQWAAIKTVCSVCDCALIPRGNGYKLIVHDNWSGSPVALYSPGNIINGSFVETEIPDIDKKSKFEMNIIDSDAGFEETMIPLYDEDAGHSAKVESVEGVGITNRTQAARKLKRMANYNVGVTHQRKFSVGLDGLSCEELDVVYVIPPEKDGGRVSAYNGGTPAMVTLDKEPVQSGDDKLVLRTHNAATGYDLVQVMTVLSVDGYDVTCTATPTVAPVADQTVWAYGPTSEILSEWRVVSVTERDDKALGIVHDIVTESNYDSDPSDAYDPEISFKYNAYAVTQRVNNVPTFNEINNIVRSSTFTPLYDYPIALNRTIVGNAVNTVTWSATDGETSILMSYRGNTYEIAAGSTTDKYVYWVPAASAYSTTNTAATAEAVGNYLVAVNEDGVIYLYDMPAKSAVDIHDVAINYNTDNDQDGTAIVVPTVAGDGTAIDHVVNDDGSCDVSFEWSWAGSANDIDGWFVYVRSSTGSGSYNFGTTPSEEAVYTINASAKRVFFLYGIPTNRYLTFGVAAYRVVNTNVSASGLITTAIVQPALGAEDPYRPAASVAFVGPVTGTVSDLSNHDADDLAASATRFWAGEDGADVTASNTAAAIAGQGGLATQDRGDLNYTDGADVTGDNTSNNTSNVGTQTAATVQEVAINFDARNDRDATAVVAPTVVGTGAAVDHVVNDDGSCDVSFEWVWGGTEVDIDGFRIYTRISTNSASYNFGTTAAEETIYIVNASKRALILYGVPVNKYITFGVQAYRIVDPDVNAAGEIASAIVQPALGAEDPYRPAATVAFAGNVTGTIDGTAAATVESNAASGATFTSTDSEGITNSFRADENCDASYPLEVDWKVPTNATGISAVLLSFLIKPFRASSTTASSGGGSTPTSSSGGGSTPTSSSGGGQTTSSGGSQTSSSGGGQTTSGGGSGWWSGTRNPDSWSGRNTNSEDLSTHTHTMPSHNHDISGDTNSEYLSSVPGSHSHSLDSYDVDCSNEDPGDTNSTNLGSHSHDLGVDANHTHPFTLSDHTHTVSDHTHTVSDHTHTVSDHTHDVTISAHTHDVTISPHTHGITYGIYEEDNAPISVTYQVDNGAGYGSAVGPYTTDQLDLDITGSISGTGWKAVKFNVDKRSRILGIVELRTSVT